MTQYIIREYETGPAARLYAIQRSDTETCEFDQSLSDLRTSTCSDEERATCRRYNPSSDPCTKACGRKELVGDLVGIVFDAVQETGFNRYLFRPEDNYTLPTRALWAGPVRIYGLRFDDTLFIAGGGGAKFGATIHQSSEVRDHFYVIEKVRRMLIQRLRHVEGTKLDSNGVLLPPRDDTGRLYLPPSVTDYPF